MTNHKEALAVTNLVVSAEGCQLFKVDGNWGGAADAYLQIYDAKTLPANGAVPLRSYKVFAASSFEFNFTDEPLVTASGCVVGFSSTEATKTVVTGAGNTGSIFADGDYFEASAIHTVVGDLTTAVDTLEIWTDANGPARLTKLEVKSNSATAAYAHIFGDTPSGRDILAIIPVAAGATVTLFFGRDGWVPREYDGSTIYDGCTVEMSSTATTHTATTESEFCIRGTYKAI